MSTGEACGNYQAETATSSSSASSPFCLASLGSPALPLAPPPQGQLAHWARGEGLGRGLAWRRPWCGWCRWGVLQLELKTAHCFLKLAETEKTQRLGDPTAQTCCPVSLTSRTATLPPRNTSACRSPPVSDTTKAWRLTRLL